MFLSVPENIICAYFDCSIFGDMKQSPLRKRTLYEIEYYLEDGKYTYSDGIAYPIKKGYIRIGIPGENCNSLLPFKTKYVKFSAAGEIRQSVEAMPRYFQCSQPYEIEKMLDEMISLYQESPCNDLMLAGKLLVFLSTVISISISANERATAHVIILKAKQYIEEHIMENVRLADIARAVNLSPNYFHAFFHKVTGTTPHEYLTEYRLRLVGENLSTTSLPFSEIAENCGFCNQQYMSTLFRKRYHMSPSQFRKKSGNNYLI